MQEEDGTEPARPADGAHRALPGLRVERGALRAIFAPNFFQAEDGIRDLTVTAVQTCALPISPSQAARRPSRSATPATHARPQHHTPPRSEERRVGKSVDLGGRRIIKNRK